MKIIFRLFFKAVRAIVGPILLAREKLNTPKGVVRPAEVQQKIDQQCQTMALYQFQTCPFCIKVRRTMRAMSLNIDLRDAQQNPQYRAELLSGGGKVQVPCLRIVDAQGKSHWVYESALIIQYLRQRFD